jgi:SAM-dependent methyltransferase
MADFVARLDPITGRVEWVPRGDRIDGDDDKAAQFAEDLLASSYGDMLHDAERNELYGGAIADAVRRLTERAGGRPPRVLDIGTGTGLLAMMAVNAGATDVTACEAFEPMADVAARVLAANGMTDRVTLVRARSTDIEVIDRFTSFPPTHNPCFRRCPLLSNFLSLRRRLLLLHASCTADRATAHINTREANPRLLLNHRIASRATN